MKTRDLHSPLRARQISPSLIAIFIAPLAVRVLAEDCDDLDNACRTTLQTNAVRDALPAGRCGLPTLRKLRVRRQREGGEGVGRGGHCDQKLGCLAWWAGGRLRSEGQQKIFFVTKRP